MRARRSWYSAAVIAFGEKRKLSGNRCLANLPWLKSNNPPTTNQRADPAPMLPGAIKIKEITMRITEQAVE